MNRRHKPSTEQQVATVKLLVQVCQPKAKFCCFWLQQTEIPESGRNQMNTLSSAALLAEHVKVLDASIMQTPPFYRIQTARPC